MNLDLLEEYNYNGARSLVLLHEKYLLSFLDIWKESKSLNIILPKTADLDYKSLDTLLHHLLRAARGYMVWICKNLELPCPGIKLAPESNIVEIEADEYITYLLGKWRTPLVDVPEERFHSPTFKSNWGVDYCIDAMLEHAVMHPIRHEFQLRNMIENLN